MIISNKTLTHGFSLIEMTVVMVIVSLLVVGVIQGQDLIKQAHLRNFVSQIKSYDLAVETFKSKYGATALPGDFNRANAYGLDRNESGTLNVAATSMANYDGDGDGLLEDRGDLIAKFYDGEMANFWVHLSNAKLIKESFNQIYGCKRASTECRTAVGTGYPETKVGTGLTVINPPGGLNVKGYTYYIAGVGNNIFPGLGGSSLMADTIANGTLTPQEAVSIDTKLDDGFPLTGNTTVFDHYIYLDGLTLDGGTNCFTQDPTIYTDEDGNEYQADTMVYNMDEVNKVCPLMIKTAY